MTAHVLVPHPDWHLGDEARLAKARRVLRNLVGSVEVDLGCACLVALRQGHDADILLAGEAVRTMGFTVVSLPRGRLLLMSAWRLVAEAPREMGEPAPLVVLGLRTPEAWEAVTWLDLAREALR